MASPRFRQGARKSEPHARRLHLSMSDGPRDDAALGYRPERFHDRDRHALNRRPDPCMAIPACHSRSHADGERVDATSNGFPGSTRCGGRRAWRDCAKMAVARRNPRTCRRGDNIARQLACPRVAPLGDILSRRTATIAAIMSRHLHRQFIVKLAIPDAAQCYRNVGLLCSARTHRSRQPLPFLPTTPHVPAASLA